MGKKYTDEQRLFSFLSHSEKAVILKTHLNEIKAQGRRTDLILRENDASTQIRRNLNSREIIGEIYGIGRMTVSRYVKINDLIPAMLSLVDNGAFGLNPAVSLSYLSDEEQTLLATALESGSYKVDMKKAEILRELSKKGNLTSAKILSVLSGELNKKPKSKTPKALKLKHSIYTEYFSAMDIKQKEINEIIDRALEKYFDGWQQ